MGIGRHLIESMIEWCRERGVCKINLEVFENNTRGIELYKRLRFKIEGTQTKAIFLNGKFINEHLMGLVIEEK